MTYAVVQDVPASWERYAPIGEAMASAGPEGLIVHVAGPTDEGFRMIEVWESREAWERWRDSAAATSVLAGAQWAAPTLRELLGVNALRGEP